MYDNFKAARRGFTPLEVTNLWFVPARRRRTGPLTGFTLIELLVVISIIGFMASVVLASLVDAQQNARDKERVNAMRQVQTALQLYENDHGFFPREANSANGNITTNATFLALMKPYLQGTVVDPAGASNATFYYYYDGSAQCGTEKDAIIFARQMDKVSNSNYTEFLNTTCAGVLDGEGRGGGTQSYNIRLGRSGG